MMRQVFVGAGISSWCRCVHRAAGNPGQQGWGCRGGGGDLRPGPEAYVQAAARLESEYEQCQDGGPVLAGVGKSNPTTSLGEVSASGDVRPVTIGPRLTGAGSG